MRKLIFLLLFQFPLGVLANPSIRAEDAPIECGIVLRRTPSKLTQDEKDKLKATLEELLPALAKNQPDGILTSSALQKLSKNDPIITSHLGPTLGFSLSGVTIYQYIQRFHPTLNWVGICQIYNLPKTKLKIRKWVYFKFLFNVLDQQGSITTSWIAGLKPDDPLILKTFGVEVPIHNRSLQTYFPPLADTTALLKGLFQSNWPRPALEKNLRFIFFIFEVLTAVKMKFEIKDSNEKDPSLNSLSPRNYAALILNLMKKWEQTGKSLDALYQGSNAGKKWLILTLHQMMTTASKSEKLEGGTPLSQLKLYLLIRRLITTSWFWRP